MMEVSMRTKVLDAMARIKPGTYLDQTPLMESGLDSLDLATVLAIVDEGQSPSLFERGIDWSTLQTIGDFIQACEGGVE